MAGINVKEDRGQKEDINGTIRIFYKKEGLPSKPVVLQKEKKIRFFSKGSFAGRGMTFLFCRKGDIITLY